MRIPWIRWDMARMSLELLPGRVTGKALFLYLLFDCSPKVSLVVDTDMIALLLLRYTGVAPEATILAYKVFTSTVSEPHAILNVFLELKKDTDLNICVFRVEHTKTF